MPTLASLLRAEIRRAASAEAKKTASRLRRAQQQIRRLREKLQRQQTTQDRIERRLRRLAAAPVAAPARGRGARRGAGPAGVKWARLGYGRRVRAVRERLGMGPSQFGRLMGVSRWSIFAWENGLTRPVGRNLRRLESLEKRKAAPRAPRKPPARSAARSGRRRKARRARR